MSLWLSMILFIMVSRTCTEEEEEGARASGVRHVRSPLSKPIMNDNVKSLLFEYWM